VQEKTRRTEYFVESPLTPAEVREDEFTTANRLRSEARSWNPRLLPQTESGHFGIVRWLPWKSGGWTWLHLKLSLLCTGVVEELCSLPARMSFQYKLATCHGALGFAPLAALDCNGVLKPCKRTLACIRDTQNFLATHPKATAYDRMIYQDAWLEGEIWSALGTDGCGTPSNT
jgi:hypothetical protein